MACQVVTGRCRVLKRSRTCAADASVKVTCEPALDEHESKSSRDKGRKRGCVSFVGGVLQLRQMTGAQGREPGWMEVKHRLSPHAQKTTTYSSKSCPDLLSLQRMQLQSAQSKRGEEGEITSATRKQLDVCIYYSNISLYA